MQRNKRQVGNEWETIAANYLEQKNYKIIERNFNCRSGEIDIIALDKDYIVFVEVKYRKDISFGLPKESVNYYKQRNITRVASYYLLINQGHNKNCRFDVIELTDKTINHIENAFNPVY